MVLAAATSTVMSVAGGSSSVRGYQGDNDGREHAHGSLQTHGLENCTIDGNHGVSSEDSCSIRFDLIPAKNLVSTFSVNNIYY